MQPPMSSRMHRKPSAIHGFSRKSSDSDKVGGVTRCVNRNTEAQAWRNRTRSCTILFCEAWPICGIHGIEECAVAYDKRLLLTLWGLRCRRATIQHFRATHWFRILDSLLTTVNVISSISILFAEAISFSGTEKSNFYTIIAALVTVITATLQYILDYRIRWKTHERAAKGYGALNREIEALSSKETIDDNAIASVRTHYDHLTDSSPVVPAFFWDRPGNLTTEIVDLEKRIRGEPGSN